MTKTIRKGETDPATSVGNSIADPNATVVLTGEGDDRRKLAIMARYWENATVVLTGEGDDSVIPLRAGETVAWQLAKVESK